MQIQVETTFDLGDERCVKMSLSEMQDMIQAFIKEHGLEYCVEVAQKHGFTHEVDDHTKTEGGVS